MKRIRVCTKTESTSFAQVTYRGKNGDVLFDEWVGVAIWPEGLDIYRITKAALKKRAFGQHQRGVSTSVSAKSSDFWDTIPWKDSKTSFAAIKKLGTVAKKKAIVEVLDDIFIGKFV